MNTIFMNIENSETYHPHKLLLNLKIDKIDKTDLQRGEKSALHYQILVSNIHRKL